MVMVQMHQYMYLMIQLLVLKLVAEAVAEAATLLDIKAVLRTVEAADILKTQVVVFHQSVENLEALAEAVVVELVMI